MLVDLDGVVYRGNLLLPGAAELFEFFRSSGISFAFATNNSTATPYQYMVKLRSLGIGVEEGLIFTAGQAVAHYLQKVAPAGAGVYIIGEDGLVQPVLEAGYWIDKASPAFVLVGLDRQFTFAKLAEACVAIGKGAKLVASNPDPNQPVETGLLPGSGALVAAISACSGAKPVVVGKPSPDMLLFAMNKLGFRKEVTAFLGDRLDTDVRAGKAARVTTILVLTGSTTPEDLHDSRLQPDFVFDDLVALRTALEKAQK